MNEEEAFMTVLEWASTSKDLLIKGHKIQGDTSIRLRLSIENLLEYGDKYHIKIPDRKFLENIIKQNNELLSHYDETANQINSFEEKAFKFLSRC